MNECRINKWSGICTCIYSPLYWRNQSPNQSMCQLISSIFISAKQPAFVIPENRPVFENVVLNEHCNHRDDTRRLSVAITSCARNLLKAAEICSTPRRDKGKELFPFWRVNTCEGSSVPVSSSCAQHTEPRGTVVHVKDPVSMPFEKKRPHYQWYEN